MATTFTGYVESKILNAALFSLKSALLPIGAVTSKWELEGKRKGDSVLVPLYTGGSTGTRTLGSDGTPTGSVSVKKITLPDPTYVQWEVPSGVGGPVEFEKMASEQAKILAANILALPFAEVTSTNFGSDADDYIVKSAGDFGVSTIGEIMSKSVTKKMRNTRLVLNGAAYTSLVTSYGVAVLDKDVIRAGVLPNLGGMDTYLYADLPSNDENLIGCAIDPTSLLIGLAPLQPNAEAGDGDLIASEVVVDEETNISFTYTRWFQSAGSKMVGRMEVMADAAVGNDGVVRIVSEV